MNFISAARRKNLINFGHRISFDHFDIPILSTLSIKKNAIFVCRSVRGLCQKRERVRKTRQLFGFHVRTTDSIPMNVFPHCTESRFV